MVWGLVAFNHHPVWLPDGVEVQACPQRAAIEVFKMKELVVSHPPEAQVPRGMGLGCVAEDIGVTTVNTGLVCHMRWPGDFQERAWCGV